MKQRYRQILSLILMIAIYAFISSPVLSDEAVTEVGQGNYKITTSSDSEGNFLDKARVKLGYAFDAYRKGDIDTTRVNLKAATEWLHKAEQSSSSETARDEASNLAAEIEKFKVKLNDASEKEENSLARFWHRATSIMKRETDQLINDYIELSISEKTLKPLLDAKMHLFTAEHDLFVSHDAEDAGEELGDTLEYLVEASQIARPAIQQRIISLSGDIKFLREKLSTTKEIWINDSVINSLDKAIDSLADASESVSPKVKLRIELINADIRALRLDIERDNIKNNYETAMATLRNIINEL